MSDPKNPPIFDYDFETPMELTEIPPERIAEIEKEFYDALQPLRDAIDRCQRITGDDLAITITHVPVKG